MLALLGIRMHRRMKEHGGLHGPLEEEEEEEEDPIEEDEDPAAAAVAAAGHPGVAYHR